jgi:hypothetical protein
MSLYNEYPRLSQEEEWGWRVKQVVAEIIFSLCSAGFDSGSYFNFPFPKSQCEAQHKDNFPLHHTQYIEVNSTRY